MPIFSLYHAVPNGEYRIFSSNRSPGLYLEWQSDYSVSCALEKTENNDRQKWNITGREDGTYRIENVDSKASLCARLTPGDNPVNLLFSGLCQNWNIEPRGMDFVIGAADDATCVELPDDNWPIISERRNAQSQRWVLDNVSGDTFANTPISPGIYHIRNRKTNGQITIYSRAEYPQAPVCIWKYEYKERTQPARAWNVSSTADGVLISNSFYNAFGPRSLHEGPIVSAEHNFCRLVRVRGTPYYHIAVSTSRDAKFLADMNPRDVDDQPTTTSEYNATDERQHWEFVLAP